MATKKGHRIGEMLMDEEIITKEQLQECLQEQKVTGEKVGEVMVRKGYVSHEVLYAFLGNQFGIPYIPLSEMQNIPPAIVKLLPEQLMRSQHVVPVSKKGNALILAMADPSNVFVTDDIKLSTHSDLELRLSSEKEIKAALDKCFGFKEEDSGELVKASSKDDSFGATPTMGAMNRTPMPATAPAPVGGASLASTAAAAAGAYPDTPAVSMAVPTASAVGGDTPVINFLTSVLVEAIKVGATDVHFEPYERSFRIRWRIDGILQEVQSPPRTLATALAAKIKTMAEMDPNEKRLAQQGRLKLKIPGKDVSMLIMIAPTLWGEKIVMRILNAESGNLDLEKVGMEPGQLQIFRQHLQLPSGLILIVGPKGSGKSTTAYATLSALNQPTKNVSAVDEPSDYSLNGVNQVAVIEKRGLTYANGVRAMLEQDSDVLLVGEMHDIETARLVLDAVPTGHLIISTLHANDSLGAIQYLVNMGVESYLLGSSLNLLVNQRLVRIICPRCKESYEAAGEVAKRFGPQTTGKKVVLYRGKGCENCSKTGYRGRASVYEVVDVNDAVREAIVAKAPSVVLKKALAETPGFLSLKSQLEAKALAGVTSYEELLRVAG
ncbi:MAG: Flp pilus assembly complex ATPase component TadA [Candidatus Firestonebacteria bacterium]|nr:Flp pilus assembly complex ATPase component TadA [Candidatus Firestonebacteria bacterium]